MKKFFSIPTMLLLLLIVMLLTACNSTEDKIKIGVSIPAGANNTIKTWFEAIKVHGEAQGMDVIGIDAQANPAQQVSNIDSLLTQGVDAIIIWPLDARALQPAIDRVNERGIPVIGIDFNVEVGGPDYSLTSQIIFTREDPGIKAAELFAETFPEGAEVAGIGMAIPVPGNIFVMNKFKEETEKYQNLTWVGQQDNPTDNISGAEPLMTNLLTKHPNLQAVFTYNDESAIGAAQAVLNTNRKLYSEDSKDGIMIVGVNAEQSGIEAIRQNRVYATFNLNPVKAGVALVDYINDLLVEQKESLPKEIIIPTPILTKNDLNDFIPWEQEIELLKK